MAKTNIINKGNGRFVLENVILSFPNLFKATAFEEGQTPKFSASFMIPKEGNEKFGAMLEERVKELMVENKIQKELPEKQVFLVDGDNMDKPREEYAGHWIVKSKNATRPTVLNRDKTPLYEEDGLIYGGCIVDVIIDTYFFKHKSGNYINATVKGVRWREEGIPFGDAPLSADAFDDLDDL